MFDKHDAQLVKLNGGKPLPAEATVYTAAVRGAHAGLLQWYVSADARLTYPAGGAAAPFVVTVL
eukprot:gene22196-2044_t